MKKIKIKISKLFNSYDVDLNFNHNLNIVAGENGCGKSTILKMIGYIINNDFISLSKIPFEKVDLEIDNENKTINYKDLIQMDISKIPEFRFEVLKSLRISKSYDEFLSNLTFRMNKITPYNVRFYEGEYALDTDRYFKDDNDVYHLKKYKSNFKKLKVVYGSKMYLNMIYNSFNNKKIKLVEFKKVKKSDYFSFIDLNSDFYDLSDLSFIERLNILLKLNKIMKNKIVSIKNKKLVFHSKNTNKYINPSNLSSGEKKICQLFKSINISYKKSLLLLDEPELSLSYCWNSKLLKILKAASKKTKIIIATQQTQITDEKDLELLVPILQNYE